jgi:hypothetical protein
VYTCPTVESIERDKTHIYVAVMWLYFLQEIYTQHNKKETKQMSKQLADTVT